MQIADGLFIEGIAASIGSVVDAYDNALAESTIGLFKTEAVSKNNPFHPGPFKTIADIEYATMGWVDWYNNQRLSMGVPMVWWSVALGDTQSLGASHPWGCDARGA